MNFFIVICTDSAPDVTSVMVIKGAKGHSYSDGSRQQFAARFSRFDNHHVLKERAAGADAQNALHSFCRLVHIPPY